MKQVDYVDLLLELQSSYEQWSSPGNAPFVLDLVDRLAMSACPDEDARRTFTATVFAPLLRHLPRLHPVDRDFGARLSSEVGLELDWSLRTATTDKVDFEQSQPALKVLLYSLDEGVLARCAEQLGGQTSPTLRVATAHDHVGGPQLKEKVRNSDIIVIATRCAKHAATGFIGKYAESSKIFFLRKEVDQRHSCARRTVRLRRWSCRHPGAIRFYSEADLVVSNSEHHEMFRRRTDRSAQ